MPARRWRMAPVAYTLWQEFLRYDPADPLWPNRDRFVLSGGHASMLLYALLHLAGRAPRRRGASPTAGGEPRRHQEVPPARQRHARPSRNTVTRPASRPRPARSARAAATASAWRSRRAGSATRYNSPRLHAVRLRRLRDLQRRRSDGGRGQRGRVARRPSRALAICAGSTTATRSPSRAIPSSPSAKTSRPVSRAMAGTCCTCATPTTRAALAARAENIPPHQGPPDDDHRQQHHRLRRAAQAEHRRGPQRSRSAKRKCGSPSASTAGRKTRNFWCRTACASASPKASASAARAARRLAKSCSRRLPAAEFLEPRARSSSCCRGELAGGLG